MGFGEREKGKGYEFVSFFLQFSSKKSKSERVATRKKQQESKTQKHKFMDLIQVDCFHAFVSFHNQLTLAPLFLEKNLFATYQQQHTHTPKLIPQPPSPQQSFISASFFSSSCLPPPPPLPLLLLPPCPLLLLLLPWLPPPFAAPLPPSGGPSYSHPAPVLV